MAREKYDLSYYEQQRRNSAKRRTSLASHTSETTRSYFWNRSRARKENKVDAKLRGTRPVDKVTSEVNDRIAGLALAMLERERLPVLRPSYYSSSAILERAMAVLTPETRRILRMAFVAGDKGGFYRADAAWRLHLQLLDTPRRRTDAAFVITHGLKYPGDAVSWGDSSPLAYPVINMEFNAREKFRLEQSRQRYLPTPSRMFVGYRGERTYIRV